MSSMKFSRKIRGRKIARGLFLSYVVGGACGKPYVFQRCILVITCILWVDSKLCLV